MSYRWTKSYKSKAWTPREKTPETREEESHDRHDHDHGYDYGGLFKFFFILKALIAPYLERYFGNRDDDPMDGGDEKPDEVDPTFVTEDGVDVFAGTDGADEIYGKEGPNYLYGGGDSDTLQSGEDFDVLIGGDGDDMLIGHGGVNGLFGVGGSDELIAKSGYNLMVGDGVEKIDGTDVTNEQAPDTFVFAPKEGRGRQGPHSRHRRDPGYDRLEGDTTVTAVTVDLAAIFSQVVDSDTGLTFLEGLGIHQGLLKPETLDALEVAAPGSGDAVVTALDPLILLTSSLDRFDDLKPPSRAARVSNTTLSKSPSTAARPMSSTRAMCWVSRISKASSRAITSSKRKTDPDMGRRGPGPAFFMPQGERPPTGP